MTIQNNFQSSKSGKLTGMKLNLSHTLNKYVYVIMQMQAKNYVEIDTYIELRCKTYV